VGGPAQHGAALGRVAVGERHRGHDRHPVGERLRLGARLLDAGANPNAVAGDGLTPLDLPVAGSRVEKSLMHDQVKVLPFLPACYLMPEISEDERTRVRNLHQLPERYLFYPAQFWPHKNHKRIVQALGLLKDRGVRIDVVFCGSHQGKIRSKVFREVMTLASRAGIEKNVHYKGYVPDHDMSGLYTEAAGLVMPTFFGPTNIPVLEAWAVGCPVLTSDIRGIREQVDDAGILADPRSVESIAEGIHRLWTDEYRAADLARRGRERLAAYTQGDYRRRLIDILEEGKMRRFGVHAKAGAR